jgi:hypothetical protein
MQTAASNGDDGASHDNDDDDDDDALLAAWEPPTWEGADTSVDGCFSQGSVSSGSLCVYESTVV